MVVLHWTSNKSSLLLSQPPTTHNISELLSWGCMFALDFNLCYDLYYNKAIHYLNYSVCLFPLVSSQLSNPGSHTSKRKYYLHYPDYLSIKVMPPTELAQNFYYGCSNNFSEAASIILSYSELFQVLIFILLPTSRDSLISGLILD